jgi:hypothetical protein
MIVVHNLMTRDLYFYTCSPREAVIAAYAQSLGDWNTWNYEEKYGHMPIEGNYSIAVGDFCTLKEMQDL